MAFIKICGMTDAHAVDAALSAGVDAMGFVFAPSVRQVTPAMAAQLARPARGRALCVAVTLHPDAVLLREIFEVFGPDVLQTNAEDFASMALPAEVNLWPVVRGAAPGALTGSLNAAQPVLFEGPRSGTGQVADWSAARLLARRHRLILAGGLSPANVAAAISAVQPFGVDVSCFGGESPGRNSARLFESRTSRSRAGFTQQVSGELT